ncbi:hypothetical protein AM501_29195 [Aneurinibacillus migulanus]|uniref:YcdB/YcdC domain-containing protein n=1 Tax=Aneurinibacillus migulanus TaxID=47500 RepID=UPI0005BE8578|nr:YcdB/YcdC domain-containing protein [Aneurinibacillus migulanus]KIV52585.1 hypothetical protein TS64_21310 [Aneurinibacillus migulanus]KPD04960.1 hypothetical protein AM501_29195 [Aneurinibacillus migulanus]MCP1357257.1 hypothetical protein [Aneurinibacillus migulanus]
MKHSLPLAALLLASSLVPAAPALAAEGEAVQAQPAESATSNTSDAATENLVPIPPVVQKTMDRLFTLQPELKKLNIITSTIREDNQHFRVYLSDKKEEELRNSKEGMSAHLEFDEKTGELLLLNVQAAAWSSDKLPSLQLTYETAEKFLTQWLGAEERKQFGKPVSRGSSGSTAHNDDGTQTSWRERHAQFPLILNGIPVEGDVGPRIGVDASGHITSYTYSPIDLNKVTIPKPDTALPVEEIKQKIATADSLGLYYMEHQPEKYSRSLDNTKSKPALLYDLQQYGYYQPQTGKAVDTMSGKELADGQNKPTPNKKVVLYPKGEQLIVRSEEEAKQLLAKVFNNKDAVAKLRVEERRGMAWEKESPQQMYEFSTEDHKIFASVAADKKTGQVQYANLQLNTDQKAQPAKVAKDRAFATARNFLEKYASPSTTLLEWTDSTYYKEPELPSWVDKSKLPEGFTEHQPKEYSFFFYETYQGVPIMDRTYQVSVDNQTGNIVSFSLATPKDKLDLPDSKDIVTKEQALEAFLKNKSPKLQYVWPQYFDQRAPAPILVYAWDYSEGFGYVDALTGQYIIVPSEWDEE